LESEGVTVANDQVDLSAVGIHGFASNQPLALLKDHQATLPERIELSAYSNTPDQIAGVDLSYLNDGTAVACYAEVETKTGQLIWSATVHRRVAFPYISGYLAYRELPILLDLIEHVQSQRTIAEVVFVGGNGYLHPRRAGIASHLGVLADLRTVGVGKKLLCGKTNLSLVEPLKPQPVMDAVETIGMAAKAEAGSRPVFVSAGHRMDAANAARLAMRLFHGHRLPEPIYHADALSRREAKLLMSAHRSADLVQDS
jgi:deoxyribonuclease V